MSRWIYILILLCACNQERWQPSEEDAYALYGIVENGETPQLQIISWAENTEQAAHRLAWIWPDGVEDSFASTGDYFELQSTRVPLPGDTCQVRWTHVQGAAIVEVIMPAALQIQAISNDTISVANPQPIHLDWFEVGSNYEYVVVLECLETNKVPIEGQLGNFDQIYGGPQVSAGLSLPIERFSYYGSHRLVIYALSPLLMDVYFYDPSDIRGLLEIGPDNVAGGKGFVAGTTRLEILLEVQ